MSEQRPPWFLVDVTVSSWLIFPRQYHSNNGPQKVFFQLFVLTPYLGLGLRWDISRLEDWSLDFWFCSRLFPWYSSFSVSLDCIQDWKGFFDRQTACWVAYSNFTWNLAISDPSPKLQPPLVVHLVEKYGCVQEGEEEEKNKPIPCCLSCFL